jgi:type III restriction enzyme
VKTVEGLIRFDGVETSPVISSQDALCRRPVLTRNLSPVIQHICETIRQDKENAEEHTPVFDRDHPRCSPRKLRAWYAGTLCERTKMSPIRVCVCDSSGEAYDVSVFDKSALGDSWVRNDHLGFEMVRFFKGVARKFRSDFLARLKIGEMRTLRRKGKESGRARAKREDRTEWVQAANTQGGSGDCRFGIARGPREIRDRLRSSLLSSRRAAGRAGSGVPW